MIKCYMSELCYMEPAIVEDRSSAVSAVRLPLPDTVRRPARSVKRGFGTLTPFVTVAPPPTLVYIV